MPKKAANIIHKAVRSAVANAENNLSADGEKLVIKSISVDGGPSLKRFQPVSKGMAHHILKRTSHITVIVSDQEKFVPKGKSPGLAVKSQTKIMNKEKLEKGEIIEKSVKIKAYKKPGTKEKK